MDMVSDHKGKKGLVSKTWEHYKSFHGVGASKSSQDVEEGFIRRTRSLPPLDEYIGGTTLKFAPKGCFSVYVGPKKQRFVIKAKHANHSLFKALLDESESEFGYKNGGPLVLPCEINDFVKVLLQIDDCYKITSPQ
uniref:Auxin-responsive protein SAUR32-like n=1 Tax=Tanacetum cinerariifolium TaxID=118510 RepID=A0A6L2N629_TANCI|nr:auxin-responsive protein SAUR32-like [Tanacetum cinerariifolium]